MHVVELGIELVQLKRVFCLFLGGWVLVDYWVEKSLMFYGEGASGDGLWMQVCIVNLWLVANLRFRGAFTMSLCAVLCCVSCLQTWN